MAILVLRPRVLRPVDHEVDHIVDRCVVRIPGLLTNVIAGLCIRHIQSLSGIAVGISRHWVGSSLPAGLCKEFLERCDLIDLLEFIGDLADECGSLDSSLVAGGRADQFNAELPRFVPATVPTVSGHLDTLILFRCEGGIGQRGRKRPVRPRG